jgi:hypothetical protein
MVPLIWSPLCKVLKDGELCSESMQCQGRQQSASSLKPDSPPSKGGSSVNDGSRRWHFNNSSGKENFEEELRIVSEDVFGCDPITHQPGPQSPSSCPGQTSQDPSETNASPDTLPHAQEQSPQLCKYPMFQRAVHSTNIL